MPDRRDPGVYVEELPTGPRPIAAVDTSVCAFVGRAARGPTDTPCAIDTFARFEQVFGGLWAGSRLAFAVRDFFLNGGRSAVVVRAYRGEGGPGAKPGRASLSTGGLVLEAATEGEWGNALRARVDHDTRAPQPGSGETPASLFNLTVRDGATGVVEEHRDLVVSPLGHPRHVATVLEDHSQLVRARSWGEDRPPASGDAPDAGRSVWQDNTVPTSSGVTAGGIASDGEPLTSDDFIGVGRDAAHRGLFALRDADLFTLLVIPAYTATDSVDPAVVTAAAALCEERRAMLLLDPPPGWDGAAAVTAAHASGFDRTLGTVSRNAALFYPRARQPNPLRGNVVEELGVAGAVAGVFARTDAHRGVWKAPAGAEATLVGVSELQVRLTDADIGALNPIGVNSLRALPGSGHVVWGARTLEGSDLRGSDWTYVPVRRTALMIEESVLRGTRWAVFEPNDEPLWAGIRATVGGFLDALFRQGAFQGRSERDAYFVRCDRSTTTQADLDSGTVTVVVGFAPLKPAEFVIVRVSRPVGPPGA